MCVKPEQLAFISFFSCRLSLLNVLTITACGLCSNAYLVQYNMCQVLSSYYYAIVNIS